MRRYLLPALMISLLLTGCGGSAGLQQKMEEQREHFAAAEEIALKAHVTALLDSEVFDCTLLCTDTGTAASVEVLEPESVAGIRALVKDGGVTVEYEAVSIGVGSAGLTDVTPISALPMLTEALRHGLILRCWQETDGPKTLLAARVYVSDAAELTVWYDADTMTPLHGEFSRDGVMLLTCDILEFTDR